MQSTLTEVCQLIERKAFRNEEHIRVCVVCRILSKLGWNIWNPDEVDLEFAVAPHEDLTKVDIALRSTPLRPDVFIEVKALGQIRRNLGDIERQLRDYNRNNTAMFSIITDGAEWRFYYSQAGGEFSQKCFKVLNLSRESVEDVELSFKTLLEKKEIQNGDAERQAIAYLRLTQRQRLMEDLLPEARRKAMEPPFPSLPKALSDLVSEQGIEISSEEAAAFIGEFQKGRPIVKRPNEPQGPTVGIKTPMRKPEPNSSIHQIDPKSPGDLRFTRIIEGRIGYESAGGWSDLVKAGLRIALTKGFSVQELGRRLTINIKTEPYDRDGYKWHPELKISIQGFDTKKAADNLYRLARLLDEELYIRLYWRDSEDSAHPGDEGTIQWTP